MKISAVIGMVGLLLVFGAIRVSAHVSVDPKRVAIGWQSIVVRVPNERDIPTTELRLVVPAGVEITGIMPVPGWAHAEKRAAATPGTSPADEHEAEHAEEAKGPISEIVWSGGKIGVGEFQEFKVNIRTTGPSTAIWKAYQKYGDGEVVAWDDSTSEHPAPKLEVAEAAVEPQQPAQSTGAADGQQTQWLSVAAVILSLGALAVSFRKK